jgi:hypothetical protein
LEWPLHKKSRFYQQQAKHKLVKKIRHFPNDLLLVPSSRTKKINANMQ